MFTAVRTTAAARPAGLVAAVLVVGLSGCAAAQPAEVRSSTTSTRAAPTGAAPTSAAPTGAAPTGGLPTASDRWAPPARVSWQWQLSGSLDLDVDAEVFDVDLFTTSSAQVQRLRDQGRRVICYLDAGSYETDRPDSAQYPAAVLGQVLDGWPDERWLDIRRLDVLLPLIGARMDLCARKGFDAVEPDNVDGYANDSGFPLTAADQLRFNREIATLAHDRGLAIGLKNDLDQIEALEPDFDFAVNEQCAQYDECERLMPFVEAGKPVLQAEYELEPAAFCAEARAMGFSAMRKSLELDASRTAC